MKLRKYNSVTFDQNIMKIKFLLPLYVVLASITFCSRKASDNKEEKAKIEKVVTDSSAAAAEAKAPVEAKAILPDVITGTLELDTATNRVYADLLLNVPNTDFKYANSYMSLQTTPGNFKGLAFRYFDTVHNDPDNGGTTQMHVVFNFANDKNWAVNDLIRVMSFDEDQQTVFQALKPYFEQRMSTFQNNPITAAQLSSFNATWNAAHTTNPVTTGPSVSSSAEPAKKGPDGKPVKMIFSPRLTRDDSILSLTRK
jgi:hypothetical protein